MKLSTLQKFGGLSLIAGAMFLTVYAIFFNTLLPIKNISTDFSLVIINPHWIWITSFALAGIIFLIFGFTAVYSRLYKESGITGLIGYLLISLAYILQACQITWEIFIYPIITKNSSSIILFKDGILEKSYLFIFFQYASLFTILAGISLFCLVISRSNKFHSIAGILVFIGSIFYGIGSMLSIFVGLIGIVVFSIGCFMLGTRLMREIKE